MDQLLTYTKIVHSRGQSSPTPDFDRHVAIQIELPMMAKEALNSTSQSPPSTTITPKPKPDADVPINRIDKLAPELKQIMLRNLSYSDLKHMERVSKSWSLSIDALKQHHNRLVTHKYALEATYFGSHEVDGWLMPHKATMDQVIKVRPARELDSFPKCPDSARNHNCMGTDYVRFLASYRAEYEQLCSLVLVYVRRARPGLRLDRKALYRVLLEWNTFRWRGHRCYPIPVLASEGGGETSESVILDFLPSSLLVLLERRLRFYGNSSKPWELPVPKQACIW